jgi:hypothetical protein
MGEIRRWRISEDGRDSGALHAGIQAGGGAVGPGRANALLRGQDVLSSGADAGSLAEGRSSKGLRALTSKGSLQ